MKTTSEHWNHPFETTLAVNLDPWSYRTF